jgi:hypothetical protein
MLDAQVKKMQFDMTDADFIHIINKVEYILALEAGCSQQNAGFIASFLETLKARLQRATKLLSRERM